MGARTCMVNLSDDGLDLCKESAAYKAWVANCSICWLMDCPECVGHPVCIKHGAELRTESDALKDKGKPADLVRICSLAGGRPTS